MRGLVVLIRLIVFLPFLAAALLHFFMFNPPKPPEPPPVKPGWFLRNEPCDLRRYEYGGSFVLRRVHERQRITILAHGKTHKQIQLHDGTVGWITDSCLNHVKPRTRQRKAHKSL